MLTVVLDMALSKIVKKLSSTCLSLLTRRGSAPKYLWFFLLLFFLWNMKILVCEPKLTLNVNEKDRGSHFPGN